MSKRIITKKEKDRRGLLAIIIVIAVFIIWVLWVFLSRSPDLDDENCPKDAKYRVGQIAVVLDPSDSLHSTQRNDARKKVLSQLEAASEYTEILLYRLPQDAGQPARVEFRVCVPKNPDQINWFEGLRENRSFARRRYDEKFIAPLDSRLNDLLSGPGSMASPLLKTIQDMAVDAFQSSDSKIQRQLLLVSDMVQHSEDWSFFRDPVDFAKLASHPDYPTIRVELDGVEITVFLLARRGEAGRIQTRPIQEFWEEYFLDQGTQLHNWNRVTG